MVVRSLRIQSKSEPDIENGSDRRGEKVQSVDDGLGERE
jgi:hypothetical protein